MPLAGLAQGGQRLLLGHPGQRPHRERRFRQPRGRRRAQPGNHPVDRADPWREGGRVHQERQPRVPGPRPGPRRLLARLELEIGGVTVVPVRDESLVRGQVRGDRRLLGGIGHAPEPVPDPVLGVDGDQRFAAPHLLGDLRGGGGRPVAVVEQEDRLQVGPGRLHELAPPGDRPRNHVLVREHRPGAQRCQPQRPDQPALEHLAARQGLLVDIQRRNGVRHQDAFVLPVAQQPGRVGVGGLGTGTVTGRPGIMRILAGEDQTDNVVRIGGQQVVFGVMGNHVIRWRGDLREAAHAVLRITQPAERRQHEAGCRRRAGRKDLHICQKHRTAATIPVPAKIPRPASASGPGERGPRADAGARVARPWGMNVTTRPL